MSIIYSDYLLGFPLDSKQIGYHNDGFPAYSNEYNSSDYRNLLRRLISSGVIADENGENSLKPYIVGGATSNSVKIAISHGSAMIDGGLVLIGSTTPSFNIAAPSLSGSDTSRTKTTYVFLAYGLHGNEGEKPYIYTQESSASGNTVNQTPTKLINGICIARVVSRTTKSGSSYTYSHSLTDMRASEYCGWAAPFVDVDTSAYYDAVQQVVNESKAEVEAAIPTLLENAQDGVDSAIANLEQHSQAAIDSTQGAIDGAIAALQQQTQNAIDLAQGALDETLAGELDGRLDAIEDGVPALLSPTVEIPANANLNDYTEPGCYFCKAENTLTLTNRPMSNETSDLYMWVIKQPITENSNHAYIVTQFALYGGNSYTVNFSMRQVDIKKDGTKSGSAWYVFLHNYSNLAQYLGAGSITTNKIQDSAITTTKLADDSVTSEKVADNAINTAKIADNSVGSDQLTQELRNFISQTSEYDDLDNPPNLLIFRSTINPVGFPSDLGGNRCTVIQCHPTSQYSAQIAFGFGNPKLAYRHRNNSSVWSSWKYLTFS